jgi:hypothetical protein
MLRPPVVTGFAAVLASGLVHGLWTGRWHPSRALEDAVARVEKVPLRVGDWQGRDLPVDREAFAQAGARGYWMRDYTNQRTGESVTVLLMCGPWGKMSVHTPDLCYRGAGYEVEAEPVRQTPGVPGVPAEFWSARLAKREATAATALRIHWAWSADGSWRAPDRPRWTFAGSAFLFKLYLVRGATGEARPGADASLAFARALLPALDEVLFAPTRP